MAKIRKTYDIYDSKRVNKENTTSMKAILNHIIASS